MQSQALRTYETREDLLEMLPKGGTWVELGVFKGDFAEQILKIGKPERLLLVDIWPQNNFSADVNGNGSEIFGEELYDMVKARFAEYPNVHLLKSLTYYVLEKIPDETIDVIYIDADHSYEGCMNDLTNCDPLVKNDGLILGHDFDEISFPGVIRAVQEFVKSRGYYLTYITNETRCPTYVISKTAETDLYFKQIINPSTS
jgi:hypothetical protein